MPSIDRIVTFSSEVILELPSTEMVLFSSTVHDRDRRAIAGNSE